MESTGYEPMIAVAAEIASKHGETVKSLSGYGNNFRLARIRAVVALELRSRCGASLSDIGALFGRHHTSILHGIQRLEAAMPRPPLGV